MKDRQHYETQAARALDLLERALNGLEPDHTGRKTDRIVGNAPMIAALSQAGSTFMHAAEYVLTEEVFGPSSMADKVMRRLDSPPAEDNLRPFEEHPQRLELTDDWGRPRCQKMVTYVDVQETVQCAEVAGHPGDCDPLPTPPQDEQPWMPQRPATGYPEARGWSASDYPWPVEE